VTVATFDASLVNVNAPSLLLVGAVNVNDSFPKFLAGTVNVPNVGVARITFNVPLVELAA
jgi:hypothetical protein